MLESKNTQFTLSAEGQILWQEKVNNPMPGKAVAQLKKGEAPLKPVIEVMENDLTAGFEDEKRQTLLNHLKLWLNWYMGETIGALVALEEPQGVAPKDDPVSKIAQSVYERMGIVPREELEDVISQLDAEMRAVLRGKKIRLGPILVFMPELNKPAAVRLRAMLWSIHHDLPLPANVPADGIVSVKIEDEGADPLYYRSIGYPLYGGRAVRIDMLDRVISCVYDHAEGGKFQARHEMAEWLGSSIEGLYKVLESMGHSKIYDPTEQAAEEGAQAEVQADEPAPEKPEIAESPDGADEKKPEDKPEDKPAPEKKEEKPELATFRLKKGKAFQSAQKGAAGGYKGGKKPFNKDKKPRKDGAKGGKPKSRPPQKDKKERGPRVISVEAKTSEEDNPFAVLQQLKK